MMIENNRKQVFEVIRGWEKNPDTYSSGITNSAFVIMERPYASADTRLRSLVDREKLMPQALEEARRNLKNPPRIFTEIAIEQVDGDISFFEKDVPSAFLSGADGAEVAKDAATKADFAKINVPTWIVDADHDEMITHDQPRKMADWTPGAGLLIEPDVSHFAFLQDPEQFNRDVLHFLQER